MDDYQLPSDLQQLERDLADRWLPAASAGLRQRVLDDLPTRLRAERSRSRWQFAAAVAATVLVWMNLSMSATQATDFGLRPNEPTESIETTARQIEQLVPEFSPVEARRQAMLLRAGSNLICLPDLSKNFDALNQTNVRQIFQSKPDHEKCGE
jgi:hypothetical protein